METLEQLKERINLAHGLHVRVITDGLKQAKSIGEMLVKAKSLVPYGKWVSWMHANISFSGDSARLYMRVFTSWEEIDSKLSCDPPEKRNFLRAREALGNKKPYCPTGRNAVTTTPKGDWSKSASEASDGDLIEMLVDILASRADPERIINAVRRLLPTKKRTAPYSETWSRNHPSRQLEEACSP